MRWCFQGFNSKTISPSGKSSETLSNAREPWYHKHFQYETRKWIQQVFKAAVDSPSYCWVTDLKKEVVLPLLWELPVSLIGIQASSWEHPVLVPNCTSWPTSTCLSERPWWGTLESGCPKRSLGNWLHSPTTGREQDTLFHSSVLSQWNKDDSVKLSLVNVSRVLTAKAWEDRARGCVDSFFPLGLSSWEPKLDQTCQSLALTFK